MWLSLFSFLRLTEVVPGPPAQNREIEARDPELAQNILGIEDIDIDMDNQSIRGMRLPVYQKTAVRSVLEQGIPKNHGTTELRYSIISYGYYEAVNRSPDV
ncbi:hypothetical protein DFH27DRAFT_243689 [Peziza echinospora]|nr:hypothetical protein DFH27DRAFT_243689 [Peziza echinospora]